MILSSYRVITLVQIPQKINNIVEIFSLWMWIADAKRPGEGGRLNADKGARGVKNWQNLADIFYV